MKIGVKYCGGCNSIYDRGRQVELIKKKFPEHTYMTTADGYEADLWLTVCGCLRACASTEGLQAGKKLFVLSTERSFHDVHLYLEAEAKKEMQKETQEETQEETQKETQTETQEESPVAKMQQKILRVGQEAEFSKTFYKDDVELFAALTGDHSRLHTDMEFAKDSIYGKPVVHGVLAASLISTVMGMKLPGEGTVFVEENVRFCKPVFYGDTVTAKVRFVSCREGKDRYIGTFSGICVNRNGEVLCTAHCRQLMPKTGFFVENPEETAEEL